MWLLLSFYWMKWPLICHISKQWALDNGLGGNESYISHVQWYIEYKYDVYGSNMAIPLADEGGLFPISPSCNLIYSPCQHEAVQLAGPLFDHTMDINAMRPQQNGPQFADNNFKCIFFNEKVWILIKISVKFVGNSPINNKPALVQIMAWRQTGDKPLSEAVMVQFTDAYLCHKASMS